MSGTASRGSTRRSSVTPLDSPISHHRTDDETAFSSAYALGSKVGQGSFGTVRLVKHKSTLLTYACKIMRKRRGAPNAYEQIQREVDIMKRVRHPHIVQLKEVFETPHKFFLVMEYCKGGELVQRVRSRKHCTEDDVRTIMGRLVEAIAYLHDQGIVHRDIKPENILISSDTIAGANGSGATDGISIPEPLDIFNIKVSDFGLATFTGACNMMENIVGTPLYMAPEIVQNLGYSAQCDLWSIGVLMYLLLCGYRGDAERALHQMIQEGRVDFPDVYWNEISPGARNLVESILRIDPAKRITAREVLMHPWMRGTEMNLEHNGPSTVLELMKSYNAERRFRRTGHAIVAFLRFRTIQGVRRTFAPTALPAITSGQQTNGAGGLATGPVRRASFSIPGTGAGAFKTWGSALGSGAPAGAASGHGSRTSISTLSCDSIDSYHNRDEPGAEGGDGGRDRDHESDRGDHAPASSSSRTREGSNLKSSHLARSTMYIKSTGSAPAAISAAGGKLPINSRSIIGLHEGKTNRNSGRHAPHSIAASSSTSSTSTTTSMLVSASATLLNNTTDRPPPASRKQNCVSVSGTSISSSSSSPATHSSKYLKPAAQQLASHHQQLPPLKIHRRNSVTEPMMGLPSRTAPASVAGSTALSLSTVRPAGRKKEAGPAVVEARVGELL
ncbi:kinase-like domain-containing protein [Fimicolochytrium jonesii]|uniref:kinase-like domain-containing protein n=1 Tax=Fimicolochytrium jonesii TaxID=1396493 RepID=UPI0022FEF259|nr:kinase-like domain-containing protein [Fimicolochytrium jonesii]KAI8815846.1 kinase-like domain-containing protein [Fimicolochytrium jonesii]